MKFEKLGLNKDLLKVIQELKFEAPSEIQAKTIPLVMKGLDVIGYAATGSGKTLAFGSGIIDKAEKGKGVQALVLTPTRELAVQVADALKDFSKYKGLKIVKVYGGVGIQNQIVNLKKADVVVGTPGRILDHMEKRTLDLTDIKVLVLDEADRLVDMGFLPDVEKIIKACPPKRQTMLFSATSSLDIDYIKKRYMIKPETVEVIKYVDPTKLKQIYYDVPTNQKFSLLVHLLKNDSSRLVMVFCNTKTNTDIVAKNLKRVGINAMPIHGGINQSKRSSILQQFHDQHVKVLVCTDVAARGLDIKNVTHVYNYDSSKNNKEYIHRVGRTARAGEDGEAISIISERDYDNFRRVMEDSSLKIERKEVPDLEKIPFHFKSLERNRGRGFGRDGPRRNYGRRDDRRESRPRRGNYNREGPRRSFRRNSRPGQRPHSRFGRKEKDRRYSQSHKPFKRRKFGDRSRDSRDKQRPTQRIRY